MYEFNFFKFFYANQKVVMENGIIKESDNNYKNCISPIQLPSRIPKLEYKYLQTSGNKRHRPILIRYGKNEKFIDEADVNTLKNHILETKSRFVYPLEFVNFAKKHVYKFVDKLIFTENHLRKLQIWSNQLREMASDHNRNFDAENYMAYIIGLKAIKYATEDNK